MRRPRFTIASLLVLVLFVAVGVAALRAADESWDSGVFGATWLILLAAVLLAALGAAFAVTRISKVPNGKDGRS